jgi:hypothetical protein
MSRETYRGLTIFLTILCVVLLLGLTFTVLNYSSSLREKDELIANLNNRLNTVEEWLRGNVSYYEGEVSSLMEELKSKEVEAEALKAQVEVLKAQVSELQSRLEALRVARLIMVNLKGEDVRPFLGNPYLHVYGAVCNVGLEKAYNSRLHVTAYQADGVVAIDTYVILGDIEAGTWKNVDAKIYYTGSALANWTMKPEWVNMTETLRFEKLEIPTAYAVYDAVGKAWTITLEVKNTGTVDVILTDVLVNGRSFSTYVGQVKVSPSLVNGLPVLTGGSVTLKVVIGVDGFKSGQSITITLHTSSGQDYSKTVVLP